MNEDFDVIVVGSGFGGSVAVLPDLLVIPVYQGRELWRASLDSWGELLSDLPRILVSINGVDFEKDLEVLTHSALGNHQNLELLVTGANLTAPDHFGFLVAQSRFLRESDVKSVMLWTHDDVCFPDLLASHMHRVGKNSASLGKWRDSGAQERKRHLRQFRALVRKASLNSRDSVMSIVNDIENLGHATSVSGVVTSRQAILDCGDWIKVTSRGGRSEYMLVTHKTVETLIIAEVPYVQITIHPYQESALGSRRDWWFDEGVYQAWLIRQYRVRGWMGWSLVALKLFRAMMVRPRKFLRLISFLRTTNRSKF